MSGFNSSSRSLRCRSQCDRPHLQPHAPRRTARLASSGQLMAQGSGLVLPRFGTVPVVHRLVADDRLAVMLAMALVDTDIAVPGDWKRTDRDPTSFIRITLDRWIGTHGGSARIPHFIPELYPQLRHSREGSVGANLRFKSPMPAPTSRPPKHAAGGY